MTLILSPSMFFFSIFGRSQNDDKCQFLVIYSEKFTNFFETYNFS
jgi:hypothetical protein